MLLGFLLAAAAFAAGDEEIRAAEKGWAAAVLKRDSAALEKIYSPDLIYAHSTGVIENRSQYLERLKSGAQKYDGITFESSRVVPYGSAAVAHSIARMQGTSNGRPFDDRVMMIHFWVKQGGVWKLAGHQTTKLAAK